jgi:SAM-dependent methyltransferase
MITRVLSRAVFAAYRALPPEARYKLKSVVNANGHGVSKLDRLKGMRDAEGKKRLDRAMQTVVQALSAAGIDTLEGASCLEVGAGFAPADTLCFHLLGAKQATATDYNRILQPDALRHSVASADVEQLEKAAAAYVSGPELRQRLAKLREACEGGLEGLEPLGIAYQAPVDLSVAPPDAEYDLIYSISVFEHVPVDAIGPLLANLARALTPIGCMLHDVHLEDHLDFDEDPFGFLRSGSGYSPKRDADARGNRVRFGQWERIFAGIPDTRTEFVWRHIRPDGRPAMEELLPEFAALDPDDCFTARFLAKTTVVTPD